MKTFTLSLAVAGALVLGAGTSGVAAAPIAPDTIRSAANDVSAVDTVQYVWRGRRYCWYDGGWQGSGWYRCGYAWRRGFGWGGVSGWNGWGGARLGRHRQGDRRGYRGRNDLSTAGDRYRGWY